MGSLLCFDQANASDAVIAETCEFPDRFGDVPFLGVSSDDKTPMMATELFHEAKPYSFLGTSSLGTSSPLKLDIPPPPMESWPLQGSPSSGLIRACWREANARSCSDDEVFPGATGIVLLEDECEEDDDTGYDAVKREILGSHSISSYGAAHSDSNSMHSIASMASFVAGINGNGSGSANYAAHAGNEPHLCDSSVMRSVGSMASMGSMWGGAAIPPGHVPMIDYNPHIKYPNNSTGSPTAVSGTIAALDGIPSSTNTLPKKRVSMPSKRAMSDAELMASFAPKGKRPGGPRTQGMCKVAPHPQGLSCSACGTQTTPVWRAGPHGPKTLCNACGVRYMKVAKGGRR